VLFFSSDLAARYFETSAHIELLETWPYRRQLRALYFLNVPNGEESVSVTPEGLVGDARYNSDIDLSRGDPLECRVAWRARCLLAISRLVYPKEVLSIGGSGTITLAGRVTRAGHTEDIHVHASTGTTDAVRTSLEQAAMSHMRDMWLEPLEVEDSIRFRYVFAIDPSLATQEPGPTTEPSIIATLGYQEEQLMLDGSTIVLRGFLPK